MSQNDGKEYTIMLDMCRAHQGVGDEAHEKSPWFPFNISEKNKFNKFW